MLPPTPDVGGCLLSVDSFTNSISAANPIHIGGKMKQVVVYTLHEEEQALARGAVQGAEGDNRIVVGQLDDQGIANLRAKNLIVKVLDDLPQVDLGLPEENRIEDAVPLENLTSARESLTRAAYWIHLRGPLLPSWRRQLLALQVEVIAMAASYTLEARIEIVVVPRVRALTFVRRVAAIDRTDNAHARAQFNILSSDAAPQPVTYDILAKDEETIVSLVAWLTDRNVAILGRSRRKVRFQGNANAGLQREIKSIEGVLMVEEVDEPGLHNDRARDLLKVDAIQISSNPNLEWQGAGEVVAIADTGIDDQHPDFVGRIAGLKALGRVNVTDDPHGHGTHVAGSIAGNGAASNGQFRGVAPMAKLYVQSLLDAKQKLGGLPLDLEQLFDDAYAQGARIHNNSWGALSGSEYRLRALEVDRYVWEHRDMLIVFSAGNAGTDSDPQLGVRQSQAGFPDWFSLGSPATAKNALTVGASRSDRLQGGYAVTTYGKVWPGAFHDPPIRDENVYGDPQEIAGFSSRGPCKELRNKPDLVAPGTDVFSCKSSLAPLRHYAGLDPMHPTYGYMDGTSMSAPLVSGCAALVREYFRTQHGYKPSAALVKSVLVNSTQKLIGRHAVVNNVDLPNCHQGFGIVDMQQAIPATVNPTFQLHFYDNWERPVEHFTDSLTAKRFHLSVASGGWIRICLAYTDAPGRGLQNNLSVYLERAPSGAKVLGNTNGQFGIGQPDGLNNVECIRIASAQGDYLIHVLAENILVPAQDFALVVTGSSITAFGIVF